MIEVHYNEIEEVPGVNSELLVLWLLSVIEEEGFKSENINIVFCSDSFLLEINKRFLDHDYFTDIITFDYCKEKILSGELYISMERVRDNAVQLNQDFVIEVNRVCVHGILHLCGYGDKSSEEQGEMRSKEDYYLNKVVSRET